MSIEENKVRAWAIMRPRQMDDNAIQLNRIINDLQSQLDHWKTQAMKYEKSLKDILEECPNPTIPYSIRVVEIVREALKDGGVK